MRGERSKATGLEATARALANWRQQFGGPGRRIPDELWAAAGQVRVTAGGNAAFIGPIVVSFMKRFPEVRLELLCTHRMVDLVDERFDLGIRAGRLTDSTLIAKNLGESAFHLVAAPAYLKTRGKPESPDELATHDCLAFGFSDRFDVRLSQRGKSVRVALPAKLTVSDFDVLCTVTVAGLGVALLPDYFCAEHLRTKTLLKVLPQWSAPRVPIHAVYPSSRHLSPAVRSFIDHLQKHLSPPPWATT